MTDGSALLGALVQEFSERLRRGEAPDIESEPEKESDRRPEAERGSGRQGGPTMAYQGDTPRRPNAAGRFVPTAEARSRFLLRL